MDKLMPYVGSVTRTALGVAAGYAASKGFDFSDSINEIVGVVTAVVALVWSLAQKYQMQKALKAKGGAQ